MDFDELQELPKMSSWAALWKCTPDQQFMEHLKLCHLGITIENRIFRDER